MLAVGVVAALLATGTAEAGWRDHAGMTLIVEAQQESRTETDVIRIGGAAKDTDSVDVSSCRVIFHLYLSTQLKLFRHRVRSECADGKTTINEKTSGTIFDLSRPTGTTDPGPDASGSVFSVEESGEELVISIPRADQREVTDSYISSTTNSAGGSVTRVRFGDDCSMAIETKSSRRFQFESTITDYSFVKDIQTESSTTTRTCRMVDGFRVN